LAKNSAARQATSFEISEGGMSVACTSEMQVGDRVELTPVLGERVTAVIRRRQGTMYGMEFVELRRELQEKIKELCVRLPLFRTTADI